jgi:hypothetical protein
MASFGTLDLTSAGQEQSSALMSLYRPALSGRALALNEVLDVLDVVAEQPAYPGDRQPRMQSLGVVAYRGVSNFF